MVWIKCNEPVEINSEIYFTYYQNGQYANLYDCSCRAVIFDDTTGLELDVHIWEDDGHDLVDLNWIEKHLVEVASRWIFNQLEKYKNIKRRGSFHVTKLP